MNIPTSILEKVGKNLHNNPNHPVCILKKAIQGYFNLFQVFDDLSPIVTVKANFDDVLVPENHVSRSPNDTYYFDESNLLRCHTSAHQSELLKQGHSTFLVTGDVYRRDTVDISHYPVFHQMEGVKVFDENTPISEITRDLKESLEGMIRTIFPAVDIRWSDSYFPFTDPSFEMEIYFNGSWLEVLGCGVMRPEILHNSEREGKAWAFGLGLERLAMILFSIPDIRLFWSEDPRFINQFKDKSLGVIFQSYSKYPICYKDISFWISEKFTENSFCELVRSIAGDLVEDIRLLDEFTHPRNGKISKCYRITYRSMDRSLTDEEINDLQNKVRKLIEQDLQIILR